MRGRKQVKSTPLKRQKSSCSMRLKNISNNANIRHAGLLLNSLEMRIYCKEHKVRDPHGMVQPADRAILDHPNVLIPLFNWEEGPPQRQHIPNRNVSLLSDLLELLHCHSLFNWFLAILLCPLIPRWIGLPIPNWPLPTELAGSIIPGPPCSFLQPDCVSSRSPNLLEIQ
jgi:hypothetical protein